MTDKEKLDKIVAEIKRLKAYYEMLEEIKPVYDDAICMADDMLEFIDSLKEEHVSEDLEYASRNYADDEEYGDDIYFAIKAAFKAGAKWKEQQMIEKAFNGYVIEDVEEGEGDFLLSTEYLPKSMGLKTQQKVKVIVIKEE